MLLQSVLDPDAADWSELTQNEGQILLNGAKKELRNQSQEQLATLETF